MIRLKVDYEIKDVVKNLGAKWNYREKYWYIPDEITDIEPFADFIYDSQENIDRHLNPIQCQPLIHFDDNAPFPDIGIIKDYAFKIPELKARDFVILDTETTGFGGWDEITELGIIDADGNEVYRSLFATTTPIPKRVTDITGITNEMLVGKPRLIDEWDKIKHAINGKRIMAYNTKFDRRLIIQTVDKYKGNVQEAEKLFENSLDAMEIYGEYRSKCKLAEAAKECGVEVIQTHRATDDCLMTLRVLQVLDSSLAEQNIVKKYSVPVIKSTQPHSAVKLKDDILACYLMNVFDIDEMAQTLNIDAIKIEDCIVKEFTLQEIKDIPGFKFERYYSPYEYIRVTAYLTKHGWNGQYRVLKNAFPEISYRSLKFIVKAFKKEA